PDMLIADSQPPTVARGGEILALLDMLGTPGPRQLANDNADIVTDTPALVDRHFRTLDGASSAQLAEGDESTSHNAARDYPRAAAYERARRPAAQSSPGDAFAVAGATPAGSLTPAHDRKPAAAWSPAPGQTDWIPRDGGFASAELTFTAPRSTEVEIHRAVG